MAQSSVDMIDLQTVPCHIAGMGLGIVLLEDKIVSNSLIDRQDMRVTNFIHMPYWSVSVPCVRNKRTITSPYNAQGGLLFFSMSILASD